MRMGAAFVVVGSCFSFGFANESRGITVIASPGAGPTPQAMAQAVANPSFGVAYVAGTASTLIEAAGFPVTDPRMTGTFFNGETPVGSPLPAVNGGPTLVYSGGIGVASGVCLCTGIVTDADSASASVPAGFGVGVEGPNNGEPLSSTNHGEVSAILTVALVDDDFRKAVFGTQSAPPDTTDPAVLKFDVTISKPGILRASTVFASDEFPDWVNDTSANFNDSFVFLVKKANVATETYENLARLRVFGSTTPEPFALSKLIGCGSPYFRKNQTAPLPLLNGVAVLEQFEEEAKGANGGPKPAEDTGYGGESFGATRERGRSATCRPQ